MGRAEPARHIFWGAMHANVLGRADPVQELGHDLCVFLVFYNKKQFSKTINKRNHISGLGYGKD